MERKHCGVSQERLGHMSRKSFFKLQFTECNEASWKVTQKLHLSEDGSRSIKQAPSAVCEPNGTAECCTTQKETM